MKQDASPQGELVNLFGFVFITAFVISIGLSAWFVIGDDNYIANNMVFYKTICNLKDNVCPAYSEIRYECATAGDYQNCMSIRLKTDTYALATKYCSVSGEPTAEISHTMIQSKDTPNYIECKITQLRSALEFLSSSNSQYSSPVTPVPKIVSVKETGQISVAPFKCADITGGIFVDRICYDSVNLYMLLERNGVWSDYCGIDSNTVSALYDAESTSTGHFFNTYARGNFDCRARGAQGGG